MLVLSRRESQSIMIGKDIVITVISIRGDQVRIGIEAPRSVTVHRQEVALAIEAANREAAAPVDFDPTSLPAGLPAGLPKGLPPAPDRPLAPRKPPVPARKPPAAEGGGGPIRSASAPPVRRSDRAPGSGGDPPDPG